MLNKYDFFNNSIELNKIHCRSFISAILKLKRAGFIYPIYYEDSDGRSLFSPTRLSTTKSFFDAKEKPFDPNMIQFSQEEIIGLDTFYDSVYFGNKFGYNTNTFQYPFYRKEFLIKKVPKKYHPAIEQKIQEHKESLFSIPSQLIALCPHLSEYLK